MTKLLYAITGTRNLIANVVIAFALILIVVSLVALVGNLILNPELINNASFNL